MNKLSIIESVNTMDKILGIERSQYVVTYDAAMVCRNIKSETDIIEISLNANIFDDIVTKFSFHCYNKEGLRFELPPWIVITRGFGGYQLNTPEFSIIDGLPVQTIESLIMEKIVRNTSDDQNDLELIKIFMDALDNKVNDEDVEVIEEPATTDPSELIELRYQIGSKIRKRRKRLKMTQLQLSEQLGVPLDVVRNIERGSIEPDILLLRKLSSVLNCSTDYLLGISNNPSNTAILVKK